MLRPIDLYFLQQEEPVKSCLQFLRQHIIAQNKSITETWKYGAPFYNYKGYQICYLWVHKKFNQPYIGFVDGNRINHPDLVSENRKRMKILLINPGKDIPLKKLDTILKKVIALYE